MYADHDDSDLPELLHEAIRPARKGFPREHVFAGRWRELMQTSRGALARILLDYSAPVGQREASVAASVITWLGTNIGQALLDDATRRQSMHQVAGWTPSYAASDAHLSAWAAENRRKRGISHGWRALEAILTTDMEKGPAEPSVGDYEVAEHIMFWLGQHGGQRFVQQCQAEVHALERIETYASFCRSGHQGLKRAQELRKGLAEQAATGPVAQAALQALYATHGEVVA